MLDSRVAARVICRRAGLRHMYALETADLIPLIGRTVRIRNGKQTFEGLLVGPSQKKFTRDNGRLYYGFTLEGDGFELEFAWWDWFVELIEEPVW